MGNSLDFIFSPSSIAIVGATPTKGKLSNIIMESLKAAGFAGEVYAVNPKYHGEVEGYYKDISSIGKPVDIAVYAMGAEHVTPHMRGLNGMVKGAVVVSGGFSEIGGRGKELEDELEAASIKENIRVIGPNCLGIYDTVSRVDTFFIPSDRAERPKKGKIAILSQSGSFALTAMDELASEKIGVSRVFSYGNKIDIDESECLDYLADDPHTEVVILYIEGINEGMRFVESAKRCAGKKTVLALKVGRYGSGERAAKSHTGSIAGRYEIYRAAFKKAGIIELLNYEELMDACRVLDKTSCAKGRRVAVITDGGGMGVGIADECEAMGLSLPQLNEAKASELKKAFPSYFTVGNPVDLTGSVTDDGYALALKTAFQGDDFDMAIVASLWGPPGLTDNLPELLGKIAKEAGKPVVICSPGGAFTRSKRHMFEKEGLPVFHTPEGAVRAAAILGKKGL